METEILKPIGRIGIDKEKIILYGFTKPIYREFPRKKWNLFAEDIKQLQTFKDSFLIIFKEELVGCEIDKDKQKIFCGKEPKKVMIY